MKRNLLIIPLLALALAASGVSVDKTRTPAKPSTHKTARTTSKSVPHKPAASPAQHKTPVPAPAHKSTAARNILTQPKPAVVSPPIPKKIEFAGETIDFDRQDMYERLDRELTQMCYTHSSTMLMLKRANRFFPVMAPILRSNGVPEDLVYLACIESTLNQRAYSPAKAAGIWQFMPSTAKQYGLEVSDYVDERYNIEKATAAAARYLKQAYNKYGNLESAMATYNGGQGRVSNELEAQMAESAFDLYLVEETSRYPFRVYAAKTLMQNPGKYGYRLKPDQFYAQLRYTEVTVDSTLDDLPSWAVSQGTTYALLREYNPWIRGKKLPVAAGKTYTIKIPKKESLSKSGNTLTKQQLCNQNWTD